MDWWFNQRRRNRVSKLDEKTAEFDLLVQRTKQRLVLGERIRGCVQLFERTPNPPKKVSWWKSITRKFSDL